MALLCPPSSLFRCHFLHLCTDIRSLTYLLSYLFFPMHIFKILVSAPLLSWSLRKSQYHQQIASSMAVLSLLHPLACPLSLQTGTHLTLIPGQSDLDLETFCSSYCTPHHCFAFLIHILYMLHIRFRHSGFSHTVPQLFLRNPVVSFL